MFSFVIGNLVINFNYNEQKCFTDWTKKVNHKLRVSDSNYFFIIIFFQGLQTNVLVPFVEETRTIFPNQNLSELNQDSSDRKRSSSLTEQGSRRRSANLSSVRLDKTLVQKPNVEKSLTMTFYEELTETCLDLMARYAFSPCSALPRR